jgi:hypothetical protein
MIEFLKKLFLPASIFGKQEPDGLTQTQREARIDLLLLATHSDEFVDANEDRVLERVTERFNWDGDLSVDEYINASTTQAKEAQASEESMDAFVRDIGSRLGSREQRYEAVRLCNILLFSDADLQRKEIEFLKNTSKIFGLR